MILAVGGSDHDVNACLAVDGQIAVAIEEERLNRRKYGLGGNLLDGIGWRYCLEAAGGGLHLTDMQHVLADSILAPPALYACRRDAERLDHHLLHASSAFFTAPFDRAAVLVVDNAGDVYADADGVERLQATSWYFAEGVDIRLLGRVGSSNWVEGPTVLGRAYQRGDGDHSLGHFYKKVTGALGFRYPPDRAASGYFFPEDGVTMGLAAYGDDRFVAALWELVRLEPDGGYRLVLNDGCLDTMLQRWLGDGSDFTTRAAVAAAAQEVLTRLLCHVVDHVLAVTGEDRLCLAGGVAMNSAANGEILRRTRARHIHIPPAPGDNGTAIGATLLRHAQATGARLAYSVYGGRCYDAAAIDAALAPLEAQGHITRRLPPDALLDEVAERLAAGQVVAWFEGGSETGRRALGHRSLLADPRRAEMRDRMNRVVKRRQVFRPFAPVVQEHRAGEFFALSQPSPYMQIIVPVHQEQQARLAAVTHVDGTARPQTVTEAQHLRWYRLLDRFASLTGVPVLLNTSLNLSGEPLVETPVEAVSTYLRAGIEALVMEDRLTVHA